VAGVIVFQTGLCVTVPRPGHGSGHGSVIAPAVKLALFSVLEAKPPRHRRGLRSVLVALLRPL
jgi:hypothetical protein